MINIDLTPVSGIIILTGKYLWDKSESKNNELSESSDFQIELTWGSDLMIGITIKRIIWLDEIPGDKKPSAEEEIREAYKNLHKKPVILLTGD